MIRVIIHSIFEQLASSQDLVYQTDKIETLLQNLIEQNLFTFYVAEANLEEFVSDIRKMVEAARTWIIEYMSIV